MFVAIVSPMAAATSMKNTGNPAVMAARASVPSPRPTQMPFTMA